ncbi:uncharacterized protein LOC111707050 isoform X2 [Eurytemora carolleeae]|nr:uncharacterized protein LOC111707050 isoform X2 [Eurytemora carolleeae]|eukprot:XP_023335816.1 uncharacterized protein LOC111707050 isoform X2 [Eurytemora affinis]
MAAAIKPGLGSIPSSEQKCPPNFTCSATPSLTCTEDMHISAIILLILGGSGVFMNFLFVLIITIKRPLERWSQGLIIHQAFIDCARASILLPMARSIFECTPITKCSLVETTFLLLVTVSTVNLLTVVLNDAPVVPEDEEQEGIVKIRENSQCVAFGLFMIWFSSITVNLGPTFLSGALAANSEQHLHEPSCPLVQGPYRHYILNLLWISINLLCMVLTMYHLHKLYRDFTRCNVETVKIASLLTSMINIQTNSNSDPPIRLKGYLENIEREGLHRVKIFSIITGAYLLFWGPLFLVTLLHPGWEWKDAKKSMLHEVSLHVSFVHSFVNPLLFLVLHKSARNAALDIFCCFCSRSTGGSRRAQQNPFSSSEVETELGDDDVQGRRSNGNFM